MDFQLKGGKKLTSKQLKRAGIVNVLQVGVTIEGDDEDLLYQVGKVLVGYFQDHTRLVLRERGGVEREPAMSRREQQTLEFERDH